MGWRNIPEPVLIMIYKMIPPEDVVSCGKVCVRWNQIHHDPLLWKYFLLNDFGNCVTVGIQKKINSGCLDLQEKYFCLKEHPSQSLQIFKNGYASGVLHDCHELWISNDGSHLAGCRATSLVVWKRSSGEEEFHQKNIIHLPEIGLNTISNVYFNPSCTKLLVAGTSKASPKLQILVFSIHNDPYHLIQYQNFQDDSHCSINSMRGKWICDDYFIAFCVDNESIRLSLGLIETPSGMQKMRYCGGWNNEKKEMTIKCDLEVCALRDRGEQHYHKINGVCHCEAIAPSSQNHAFQRKVMKLKDNSYIKDIKIISQKHYHNASEFWRRELGESQRIDNPEENHSSCCNRHIDHIEREKLCLVYIITDQSTMMTKNRIGFQPITFEFLNSKDSYLESPKILEFSDSICDMVVSPREDSLYISHRPNDGLVINEEEQNTQPETYNEFGQPSKNQLISTVNLKSFKIERNIGYDAVLKENIPPDLIAVLQQPHFDKARYYACVPYLADASENFFVTITGPHISIWDKEFGMLLNKITLENEIGDIMLVKFNPINQSELLTMNHTSFVYFIAYEYTKLQVWTSKKMEKKRQQIKVKNLLPIKSFFDVQEFFCAHHLTQSF